MSREVTHRYVDPLAAVWIAAARRIGLRVVRTPDAYAATDGRGTLAIGDDATLDADDSLAQMIFHELCHSLVEGPDAFARPDWGMEPSDLGGPDHDWREHACLRTQWVLAGRHGLRGVFAPTTDFRATFWDRLSGDVLSDRTDRSTRAAIAALRRADHPPWGPHLADALARSAQIAGAVPGASDTLWALVTAPRPLHASGIPLGDADGTCGTCAWRANTKCRQVDRRVAAEAPACERYEAVAAVGCQTCGACCREAYHAVEVSPRDPFVKKQPGLVVLRRPPADEFTAHLEVLRAGDRCAALAGGDGDPASRYACTVYADRPRTCRDFTLGSANCLTARRRVGLSL